MARGATRVTGEAVANSVAALARGLGVSREAVTRYLKRPDWKFAATGPWNVEQVRAWRDATLSPAHHDGGKRRKRPAQPPKDTVAGVSAGLDAELAKLDVEKRARVNLLVERRLAIELDREIRSGRYMRREDVERGRVARIHAVRARLQALPRQAASDLVGLDETEISRVLTEHCDAICREFSEAAK